MSIQLRFVVLITAVMAVLLAGLWMQVHWDEKEIVLLQQGMTTERAMLVDKLLDITGEPMKVFVTDYSPWDEMIAFVENPGAEWARINIVDVLASHQTDAAWVLRPDLTEVFGTAAEGHEELRPFPLPRATLAKIATGMAEPHFFALTPTGSLIEIRGAPIRPSDLSAVIPAARGWLFGARRWDGVYLQKLSLLAAGQASLVAVDEPAPDDGMAVTTRKVLTDWQGQPIRVLNVRHLPIALEQMRMDSRVDLLISAVFGLVALVAFYFATRHWVVRPLGVLEASLAQRSPAPLQHLRGSSQEFTRLGLLVETSLQHEQTLRQVFAAFNAIEDAVFILDTGTGRLTHVNDGAVKLLGYRHEQLQGMRLRDLDAEPGGSTHPLGSQPQSRPDTRRYRCQDGRLVEVEIREQALPTSAVTPLRVIVARDVTELKRQEQQRLQAQRLESLGNLAGGVAHDMNNMLTPITMFLEELQRTDTRPSPALLASVRSSVNRGAGMLRQLLTFGRGIAGERQPLAVSRMLDEMGRIVASTFPKSIRFESRPAHNVSSILGDATQLHQVLLNLCVNARDAMPNGGRLVLSADNLVIDSTNREAWQDVAPGRYVLIEVADSGTGIPAEQMEHIFEPFYTTKSAGQGTGLGLSTSLGIVRSHGGSILVESEPGRGARFRLILPAADKTAAGDTVDQPGDFAGRGRTVLVVEDEANIRILLENTLQRLSLKVLIAAEGEAGLALFKAHRADIALVISDLHMPGMDGLELVQAIRRETLDLPIIIMSGRVDRQTADTISTLKVCGIVDKPFGYTQIVEALRKALA